MGRNPHARQLLREHGHDMDEKGNVIPGGLFTVRDDEGLFSSDAPDEPGDDEGLFDSDVPDVPDDIPEEFGI